MAAGAARAGVGDARPCVSAPAQSGAHSKWVCARGKNTKYKWVCVYNSFPVTHAHSFTLSRRVASRPLVLVRVVRHSPPPRVSACLGVSAPRRVVSKDIFNFLAKLLPEARRAARSAQAAAKCTHTEADRGRKGERAHVRHIQLYGHVSMPGPGPTSALEI